MAEKVFKFVFMMAVILFCFLVIGVFLVIVKILFLFNPDFSFMGIHFSPEILNK